MTEARETADLYPSVAESPNNTGNFYRTGTFTPFYSGSTATVAYESDVFTTASYQRQFGTYVRIGDLVNVNLQILLDHSAAAYQNGGTGTAGTAIQGLPFRVKNLTNYLPGTSTIFFNVDTTMGWTGYSLTGLGVTNAKYILKPRELINLTNKMQLIDYENIYINNISNHSFKQRIFSKNV